MTTPLDPSRAPAPADDPAWHTYGDTILVFRDTVPPLALDLRAPIPAALAAAVRAHVRAERFGVVTPENPAGVRLDAATNAARVTDFAASLARAGLAAVRADGHGASSAHVERGFAIVAPLETSRALAAAQVQTGFFWFDGTRMWLHPTRPDLPPQALPLGAVTVPTP